MQNISEFIHAHLGRPALILGGGMTMIEQAQRAPANCVLFSANQHGALWRKCDFVVSIDNLAQKKLAREDGSQYQLRELTGDTPIISPRRNLADIRLMAQPTSSSGVTAAYCAWIMGCAPIILAGMDCYTSGVYWHFKKAVSTGARMTLANHFNRWRALTKAAPGIEVRAMGEPLSQLFALYSADETGIKLPDRPSIEKAACGFRARIVKTWEITPQKYRVGDEVELTETEFKAGILNKRIVKI